MDKKSEPKKKILDEITITIIILILFGVFLVGTGVYCFITGYDYLSLVPPISSGFLVIVTAVYVFTTSKQLNTLEAQSLEMKMDRVMRDQPLPWLNDLKFEIEQPNLYFDVPENKYVFISRFQLKGVLENLSPYPAPCVDLQSVIELSNGSNEKKYFTANTMRISALTHGASQNIYFSYDIDDSLCLFDRLREKIQCITNFPVIRIRLIYRTLSGGFFVVNNVYQIIPNSKKDDIIRDWHTQLVQFETKYKDELDHLAKLVVNGRTEVSQEFRDKFVASIEPPLPEIYKGEIVELNVSELPGTLTIEQISETDYNNILKNASYSRRLRDNQD